MAERIENELTELHPDKQLALRIENGEVSAEEVRHIWEETRDLSAQTDFDTRRAVLALRNCDSLNDAWPVFFTQMTQMMSEMRGAMVNENSKFAHLVSGAESIVKTLQAVNPLKDKLEQQSRQISNLASVVMELRDELRALKTGTLVVESAPESDAVEGELMDFEQQDEQARKDTIGSAWAK